METATTTAFALLASTGANRLVEPVTVPSGVMTALGGNYQLTLPRSGTV